MITGAPKFPAHLSEMRCPDPIDKGCRTVSTSSFRHGVFVFVSTVMLLSVMMTDNDVEIDEVEIDG